MTEKELITAQELAALLKLSVDTICRYTREQTIPYVEIGSRQYRYHKESVLAALSAGRFAAEASPPYESNKKITYAECAGRTEDP